MKFEITNEQRKYLGLESVQSTWDLVQFNNEIYLYFDGNIIRKQIVITDGSYLERQLNEITENNRQMLLSKTSKGKPKKLNCTSISKINGIGVYFSYGYKNVKIANYSTQTTFYSSPNGNIQNFDDLYKWLENWIKESNSQDLRDIEQFCKSKKIHCKIKEGDFFTFKIGRREYGFGRILLDIRTLRKDEEFIRNKNYGLNNLMGPAIIVKIYHKVNSSPNVNIEDLIECQSFPSHQIMDNCFYYGEYKIIGNKSLLPFELEFPISYSRSIHYRDENTVYLQYGMIYFETDISKFDKYLLDENNNKLKDTNQRFERNPYRYENIGFDINIIRDVDVMKKCIKEKYNLPYWNSNINHFIKRDLRNPQNFSIKREIFNCFGLDADASYAENYNKITPAI